MALSKAPHILNTGASLGEQSPSCFGSLTANETAQVRVFYDSNLQYEKQVLVLIKRNLKE
jgi:hypothetical protein